MKTFKLLILLLFPGIIFSQNIRQGEYQMSHYQSNTNFNYFPQPDLYKKDFIEKHKIRSITHRSIGKENNTIQKTSFTKKGLVERTEKKEDTISYLYLNDSLIKKITVEGKNKKEIIIYYINNKVIAKETIKDGEILSLFITSYNEDDKISFTSLQNGRKMKNNYLLKYYYDGEDLQMQTFYSKGKIIRKWDYACTSEGKEVEEGITFQFCEYSEESKDGSYIKFERRQYGSNVYLHKRYYTKDSVLYKYENVNEGDKIYRSATYGKDSVVELIFDKKDRITKSITWQLNATGKVNKITTKRYNGSKLKQSRTIFYNEQHQVVKTINQFGRREYTNTYKYDENGLITENKNESKGKTSSLLTYQYEFYE